jgi:hypothetical protein
MTELSLMLLASHLISNSTPSIEAKFATLSLEDRIKVESYIEHQDQLPQEIENMISTFERQQRLHPRRGGITIQSPTRETSSDK